jgi:nitrogen regulation protein NR(I)
VATILIVDDEESVRRSIADVLADEGHRPVLAAGADEADREIATALPDLVLLDVAMPGRDGLALLESLRSAYPHLPVVMMSGHGTIETAVRATKLGAYDFLEKPLSYDKLLLRIDHGLERARLAQENRELREALLGEREIIGESAVMVKLKEQIEIAAPTDGWVLITGENGTGKELVARWVHLRSKRAGGPFVAVNCAAIPEELIESELFGHEKGAFTGAQARTEGRFQQAEGGTLFLDEIGDMPMEAQTRLLRVLQEGEYTTVGGRTPIKTDVRIIAATHRELKTQIQQGLFREDLYYRLNVVPLRIPPLRERLEDVGDLVRHFLRVAAKAGLGHKSIETAAIERIKQYHWPGNVRELENMVRRLGALHPEDTLTADIVEAELAEAIRMAFDIEATLVGARTQGNVLKRPLWH